MDREANYKRIMTLGAWLDRFLATPLSPWDIGDLADDALKLLNIDYIRDEYDPVINGIMTLLQEYEVDKLSTIDDLNNELKEAFSWHAKKATTGAAVAMETEGTKYLHLITGSVSSDLELTFYMRGIVRFFIQLLQEKTEMPWEYVLSLSSKQKIKGGVADPLLLFMDKYNGIRDMMVESGHKVKLVRCMSGQVVDGKVKESIKTRIEFPSLIGRIFIDFLIEGGRDYGRLCKNCNKFILAERRGQRKFCSGRCRVAHKRIMAKEAGVLS